jgi:hypothetical protein
MQTLERSDSVKYTVNISQNDIGTNAEANHFLSQIVEATFALLKEQGQNIKPLVNREITPELLKKLLLVSEKNKPSENVTVNAIFDSIDKTGGLSGDGEKITQLGKDFRESFQFRADQD